MRSASPVRERAQGIVTTVRFVRSAGPANFHAVLPPIEKSCRRFYELQRARDAIFFTAAMELYQYGPPAAVHADGAAMHAPVEPDPPVGQITRTLRARLQLAANLLDANHALARINCEVVERRGPQLFVWPFSIAD